MSADFYFLILFIGSLDYFLKRFPRREAEKALLKTALERWLFLSAAWGILILVERYFHPAKAYAAFVLIPLLYEAGRRRHHYEAYPWMIAAAAFWFLRWDLSFQQLAANTLIFSFGAGFITFLLLGIEFRLQLNPPPAAIAQLPLRFVALSFVALIFSWMLFKS